MEQVDIYAIERDGTEPGKGSPIPSKRWFKRNDDTKQWLENLRKDTDQWQKHLEHEAAYREHLTRDLHY